MTSTTRKIEFPGHSGASLAARLDVPDGPLRAYAVFAHCFTCSKDIAGARYVAAELARSGIAVLRFDFTGLGSSAGEFASTNFSSNVGDLIAAAVYLRDNHEAPALLVGHSLWQMRPCWPRRPPFQRYARSRPSARRPMSATC